MNLDELDVEQLVSYLGYEYRVSNGNSGPQLNLRTCPNCGRDEYKAYINSVTGLGNCFKCSVGLNRFKLIKLTLGLANKRDVFRYAESIRPSVSHKPKLHPDAYKLNNDWVLPTNKKIELEEDVPSYLKERNIDAKLCKRFDLRVCEAGFYKYKDFSGNSKFVDFSNRILLPVRDIDGQLVTFQGRDMTGESDKRYLFPNMLPGTARFIYNAHYALTSKARKVVLDEGCFDVFATTVALESDVRYKDFVACGTFGKHLSISADNVISDDQLTDLFRLREVGVDELILLWDGEADAIAAAMLAALNLEAFGFFATVARLDNDEDPAEAGTDKILSAIEHRRKPTKFDLLRMKLGK